MYNSLGVPVPGMVESIRCLKKAGLDLLSQEDAAAAAPYFDYIIQAMSQRSSWRFLLFNSQAHAANFFALIALNFKDFELASDGGVDLADFPSGHSQAVGNFNLSHLSKAPMSATSSAPFSPEEIVNFGLKAEEYEEVVQRLGRHPKAELGMFGCMVRALLLKNSRPLLKQHYRLAHSRRDREKTPV